MSALSHGAARETPALTERQVERVARSMYEGTPPPVVRLFSDEEWDAIAEALARIEAEEGGDDE